MDILIAGTIISTIIIGLFKMLKVDNIDKALAKPAMGIAKAIEFFLNRFMSKSNEELFETVVLCKIIRIIKRFFERIEVELLSNNSKKANGDDRTKT